MKRILKLIGKMILTVVGLILLYFIAVFVLPLITISQEEVTSEDVEIHILTNGVHTDIVVPVRTPQMDWSKKISYDNAKDVDSTFGYLALGWGDKGFYLQTPTWAELKFSVAFNAAFGLSTSAIHATYYQSMEEGERCKKMTLSAEQYDRLIAYITDSFKTENNDDFIHIDTDAHYGTTDAFYEAHGKYNFFKTCNTWANNALAACGQKCCFWTASDKGIFSKYE